MNKAKLEKAIKLNREIEGLKDFIKSKYISINYSDRTSLPYTIVFKPSDKIIYKKVKEVLKAYKAELEEELKNL